jgi:hypothetical protein
MAVCQQSECWPTAARFAPVAKVTFGSWRCLSASTCYPRLRLKSRQIPFRMKRLRKKRNMSLPPASAAKP